MKCLLQVIFYLISWFFYVDHKVLSLKLKIIWLLSLFLAKSSVISAVCPKQMMYFF